MPEGPRILCVFEMAGTVNGIMPALRILESERGCQLKFVATDQALAVLTKAGRECFTVESDPVAAIHEFEPHLIVAGASAFERGNPKWTGVELSYMFAGMDCGLPVVVYRDYSGVPQWLREATSCGGAESLLHLFMFDNATAQQVSGFPVASVKRVGSAYYDALLTRDLAADRARTREAVGISPEAFVVVLNPGADRGRACEALEPVVDGLPRIALPHVVFVPTFHPKDPDAPFAETEKKGTYAARPSAPYDSIINRLSGSRITVIREPALRNAVSDPQSRITMADFIVMNPASTDTWTAVYAGVPQAITALPLAAAEAEKKSFNINELDFVADGTATVIRTQPELQDFVARLGEIHSDILGRAARSRERYAVAPATQGIADAILGAVPAPSES